MKRKKEGRQDWQLVRDVHEEQVGGQAEQEALERKEPDWQEKQLVRRVQLVQLGVQGWQDWVEVL
jgi:hypothetical protein